MSGELPNIEISDLKSQMSCIIPAGNINCMSNSTPESHGIGDYMLYIRRFEVIKLIQITMVCIPLQKSHQFRPR